MPIIEKTIKVYKCPECGHEEEIPDAGELLTFTTSVSQKKTPSKTKKTHKKHAGGRPPKNKKAPSPELVKEARELLTGKTEPANPNHASEDLTDVHKYQCDDCPRQFRYAQSFIGHLKKEHGRTIAEEDLKEFEIEN